jgi:hypothetical protein
MKTAKITIEVPSVWHGTYVPPETGGRCGALYNSRCACATTAMMRCTNITAVIFPRISKTAKEVGLL